jgi:hypothetical protein
LYNSEILKIAENCDHNIGPRFHSGGNCSRTFLEDPENEVRILEDAELTSTASGSTASGSASTGSGAATAGKFVQVPKFFFSYDSIVCMYIQQTAILHNVVCM